VEGLAGIIRNPPVVQYPEQGSPMNSALQRGCEMFYKVRNSEFSIFPIGIEKVDNYVLE